MKANEEQKEGSAALFSEAASPLRLLAFSKDLRMYLPAAAECLIQRHLGMSSYYFLYN